MINTKCFNICFPLGRQNWGCHRVIRGWCTEHCVCPSTKYHRWLSLFVGLCARVLLPGGDGEVSTDVFCRCLPAGIHLTLLSPTSFLPISIHSLPMNFLLLFSLSHLLPRSLDSDLGLSCFCTCYLARRPSVLFQIFSQNSLLGSVFSTTPQ